MSFLYDCHVHTAETSWCGVLPAEEMVRLYKDAGYTGIVIADHYFQEYFELLPERRWEDKVERYLAGYKAAYAAGQEWGLEVLFGIELRFHNRIEDFLVFGLTPEFLVEHPRLYEHTVESFFQFSQDHGLLVVQAHPFRPGQRPAPAQYLHGVEVFNGNPRHDSGNNLALEFAERHNLIQLSCSDAHQLSDVGMGGIYLEHPVRSSVELAEYLRTHPVPPRKTTPETAVGVQQ